MPDPVKVTLDNDVAFEMSERVKNAIRVDHQNSFDDLRFRLARALNGGDPIDFSNATKGDLESFTQLLRDTLKVVDTLRYTAAE